MGGLIGEHAYPQGDPPIPPLFLVVKRDLPPIFK